MKRNFLATFLLLVIVAALYRIIPGRAPGFAPQIAMALFAGVVIKDKTWAFILPLLSMFLSDLLYHLLYVNGLTDIPGFYEGQWINYILFASVVVIGFFVKQIKISSIVISSLIAPTWFFIISNFAVWLGGGGLQRPKTFEGLLMSYNDGLPFYRNSVLATCFFSALLFGLYVLIRRRQPKP